MANPDFKKLMIKDALLAWPKLDQPYRYNSQEKRSEAAPAAAQGAAYSCGFTVSTEEGKRIFLELQEHYKDCMTRNTKLTKFSKVFGMKKSEDGTLVTFTAKKRAMSQKGEMNQPPLVLDGQKKELENKRLYTGSVGNAVILAFPVSDPDGNGGVSLILDKLQVTKAVYGSTDDDFDTVETEVIQSDKKEDTLDEFGLPPMKEQQQAATDDFDDEIPF